MLPAFFTCLPASSASYGASYMSNLAHPMPPREHSAADLNSRPSTKCCSRCHNIRPLTTFINDRNIELKTCHRCCRPQPRQVECETTSSATAGDTDDSLVRCSRCMCYLPRSMFLSAAGRRFKISFNCRERQRAVPMISIYPDTPALAQRLTNSINTPAFATIPTGAVSTAQHDVIPEVAQTHQCTCCGGIYPLSVFMDQSRRPEPFTNCATCRLEIGRVPPPGRTGMKSCSRCGDLLPLAQFIDLG